eukprot:CAMPEP_0170546498 /NCGR_PEP_ID=MMETSP0211-20121228/4857_1 /TAXON_ID=311385 /ORGANISM="Pseudokeronopsis sp., Strain OXSARD2" /LENGTH=136 /DNA_ID=CAMNT_0010850993 /DNA_START=449 /DNA_END=859 /DNA_ORIENTATION=-
MPLVARLLITVLVLDVGSQHGAVVGNEQAGTSLKAVYPPVLIRRRLQVHHQQLLLFDPIVQPVLDRTVLLRIVQDLGALQIVLLQVVQVVGMIWVPLCVLPRVLSVPGEDGGSGPRMEGFADGLCLGSLFDVERVL